MSRLNLSSVWEYVDFRCEAGRASWWKCVLKVMLFSLATSSMYSTSWSDSLSASWYLPCSSMALNWCFSANSMDSPSVPSATLDTIASFGTVNRPALMLQSVNKEHVR